MARRRVKAPANDSPVIKASGTGQAPSPASLRCRFDPPEEDAGRICAVRLREERCEGDAVVSESLVVAHEVTSGVR
jgi:hypothetical protein